MFAFPGRNRAFMHGSKFSQRYVAVGSASCYLGTSAGYVQRYEWLSSRANGIRYTGAMATGLVDLACLWSFPMVHATHSEMGLDWETGVDTC